MPKDWLRYKAELHRLYIVEEKTLYQAREILKARHGFTASVRAYRMKFDEWGMRKYKSQKSRSERASSMTQTQTPSPFPPSPAAAAGDFKTASPASLPSPDVSMGDIHGEWVREPRSTRASEIPPPDAAVNSSGPLHVLESIFLHWRPDADFSTKLVSCFEDPDFNKWVARDPGPETPAVFKLIEDWVPEIEQFGLTKLLLEADLSSRHDASNVFTPWQESWYQVCDATVWEEARELLHEERILSDGEGIFPSCAEVVLAERLLESYMIKLTHWTQRPPHELEVSAKNECTKMYREILRSFHHAKEDVCPKFYRFLLRFDLGDGSKERRNLYENEYRQKFVQLSSLRPKRYCDEDEEEEIVEENGYFGDAKRPRTTMPDGLLLTPPTPDDSKYRQQADLTSVLTAQEAFEVLIRKWEYLSGFQSYVQSLLTQERSGISIFTTPSLDSPENVFDAIISSTLEAEERISLAKSVLMTSSTVLDKVPRPPWLFQWWCNLYPPSPTISSPISYSTFHAALVDNQPLSMHLGQTIRTQRGRKLFLDAAISLAGERLLGSLKAGMRRGKNGWEDRQKKYLALVGLFRERDIDVDASWMMYLLHSI